LTAWELLVEGFGIPIPADVGDEKVNRNKSLLVLGGAGGVGSLAIQIAKHVRLPSRTSL
jgi:NADPH:quinone reductase-like Zn-dependent oxidoreductase